jgi:ATP-dependent DNA helicase RecQ
MEDYCRLACEKFGVLNLKDFQQECVKQLTRNRDVFLSVKTGSGKSLCYQSFFIIWRAMNETLKCQVLVVTPLISIMKEQCEYLNSLGIRSTYLGKDNSEDSDIINEQYDFIFSSPENLLNVCKWRQMLEKTDSFRLMVVDEAHTVLHW